MSSHLGMFTDKIVPTIVSTILQPIADRLQADGHVQYTLEVLTSWLEVPARPLPKIPMPEFPKRVTASSSSSSSSGVVCQYKFTRGARKGEICGAPVVPGTDRCRTCTKKEQNAKRDTDCSVQSARSEVSDISVEESSLPSFPEIKPVSVPEVVAEVVAEVVHEVVTEPVVEVVQETAEVVTEVQPEVVEAVEEKKSSPRPTPEKVIEVPHLDEEDEVKEAEKAEPEKKVRKSRAKKVEGEETEKKPRKSRAKKVEESKPVEVVQPEPEPVAEVAQSEPAVAETEAVEEVAQSEPEPEKVEPAIVVPHIEPDLPKPVIMIPKVSMPALPKLQGASEESSDSDSEEEETRLSTPERKAAMAVGLAVRPPTAVTLTNMINRPPMPVVQMPVRK